MANKSVGFIETFGLAAGIAAADAAVKGGNVKLLGYEYSKGDGMCVVKVEGNVGAVKAAIAAGEKVANQVHGTKSVVLMARPADGIKDILIYNAENVGGEIALAKGVRPRASGHMPKLVKNWKPKDVKPLDETPEPPVVDETPIVEEAKEPEAPVVVEEAPAPEPVVVEEAPAPEPVVEEAPVEVVAPEAPAEVVAPEEEAPAPAVEEEPAPEAPAVEEAPAPEAPVAEEAPKAETPKKSTRRSGKSKKKKTTEDKEK